jgi:hypothetical protein
LAGYGFAQVQLSWHTYLGARYDYAQDIADDRLATQLVAGYLSYYTSEFLRFRAGYEHRWSDIPAQDGVNSFIAEVNVVFGSHPTEPYWVTLIGDSCASSTRLISTLALALAATGASPAAPPAKKISVVTTLGVLQGRARSAAPVTSPAVSQPGPHTRSPSCLQARGQERQPVRRAGLARHPGRAGVDASGQPRHPPRQKGRVIASGGHRDWAAARRRAKAGRGPSLTAIRTSGSTRSTPSSSRPTSPPG